jgi:hypothetical protein
LNCKLLFFETNSGKPVMLKMTLVQVAVLGVLFVNGYLAAPDAADQVSKYILDGLRTTHGVPLMTFSDNLKTIATTCANQHAYNNTAEGTLTACPAAKSAGANEFFARFPISEGVSSPSQMYRGALWTMYIDESGDINLANPEASDHNAVIHVTQMIWKSSTLFACAISSRTSSMPDPAYYCSCVFSPAGNVAGQYNSNVLPDFI